MRRLFVSLLVLLVLLAGADRIAVFAADRAVAGQLQASGRLSTRPDVSIRGVPFLTQALAGRYDAIEVNARDVTAGGTRFSDFQAQLRGVRLPLSAVRSGSVSQVPVERLEARVVVAYAELQKQLRDRRLTLSPAGGLLRVTGTIDVLGRTVSASALSSVAVRGADVVVTGQRLELNGLPNAALTAAAKGRFDFVVRIGTLPYGLRLTSVAVRPEGLVATAAATGVVLHR
ncbi:MAG: hypothetical protein JWN35_3447 [Frankiales bacterium]|jgi:hypothetical protein|nr:hypothetical protein [Frankiales bacterium]